MVSGCSPPASAGNADARTPPLGHEDPGETMAPRPAPPQQAKPRPQPRSEEDNSDIPFGWLVPLVGSRMGAASLFS